MSLIAALTGGYLTLCSNPRYWPAGRPPKCCAKPRGRAEGEGSTGAAQGGMEG